RFDSPACFAALLGKSDQGRWHLGTTEPPASIRRRYRNDSLVLETELGTSNGLVRIVDCMPPEAQSPTIVRVVEGVKGEVSVCMQLVIRYDYGWVVPWVRHVEGTLRAVGGPDALTL